MCEGTWIPVTVIVKFAESVWICVRGQSGCNFFSRTFFTYRLRHSIRNIKRSIFLHRSYPLKRPPSGRKVSPHRGPWFHGLPTRPSSTSQFEWDAVLVDWCGRVRRCLRNRFLLSMRKKGAWERKAAEVKPKAESTSEHGICSALYQKKSWKI